jgi:inhibitor of cysteine peptidase
MARSLPVESLRNACDRPWRIFGKQRNVTLLETCAVRTGGKVRDKRVLVKENLHATDAWFRINWTDVDERAKVREFSVQRLALCLLSGLAILYPAHPRNRNMLEVNESFDGRTVGLAVGEIVQISLFENRTTGFRWHLSSRAGPVCELESDGYEAAAAPPGRGGTHHWRFRAARPGVTEIKFEYRRPWEQGTPPARTFKLEVRVQSQGGAGKSARQSE